MPAKDAFEMLIEILDRVFGELQKNLSWWFGRKRRSRELIAQIRDKLASLKESADEQQTKVKEVSILCGYLRKLRQDCTQELAVRRI